MIDIQASEPKSGFAIESVGIQSLNYPMPIIDEASGEVQQVLTTWSMGVSLPAHQRGTHMSRFLTELTAVAEKPLSLSGHLAFAEKLLPVLKAESADIRTSFSWFRKVFAPVSGLAGLLECKVSFTSTAGSDGEKTIKIAVPAKALCPCSKAISDRGAHNQRSEVSVELSYGVEGKTASINQIFSLLEMSASSPVYPVLKRDDEKYVTESAYDNPVFVEDIVRRAANRLVEIPDIRGFKVQAINFESIHAHDCFARISYRAK
jgi:GTP cyclohydrolase I